MTVAVSGGTAATLPALTDATSRSSSWWRVLLATVAPLLLLGRPIGRLWGAAKRSRAQSERHQFRLLQAAIRRGRPAPLMRELMRWLDRVNDTQRPARLDQFLDRYGDPDLRVAFASLQQELDRARHIADHRSFSKKLVQARRRWLE